MQIEKTSFEGLLIIKPDLYKDERGYFFESYNSASIAKACGFDGVFIQDNEAKSVKAVLRGLHYQLPPFAQSKLVRVVAGEVLDVVVDIRLGSATFGKHFSIELSAENKKQLLVPRGFAHGYVVLSAEAVFVYKCDNYYNKESEAGIIYNDRSLNIDWKFSENELIISDRDRIQPEFANYRAFVEATL